MATTRTMTAAQRSPWRWPAAASALTIAAAHAPITPRHLTEAPYIGWSFIALETATVLLAVVLVVHDSTAAWWTAAIVPTGAIAAYLLTRSVALPQIGDDRGNWTEPLSFVALTAETLLIVVATAHGTPSWRRSRLVARPLLLAGAFLVVGLIATGFATAVTRT